MILIISCLAISVDICRYHILYFSYHFITPTSPPFLITPTSPSLYHSNLTYSFFITPTYPPSITPTSSYLHSNLILSSLQPHSILTTLTHFFPSSPLLSFSHSFSYSLLLLSSLLLSFLPLFLSLSLPSFLPYFLTSFFPSFLLSISPFPSPSLSPPEGGLKPVIGPGPRPGVKISLDVLSGLAEVVNCLRALLLRCAVWGVVVCGVVCAVLCGVLCVLCCVGCCVLLRCAVWGVVCVGVCGVE